jgi:dTDP-4-dehydrorhamnose reductase
VAIAITRTRPAVVVNAAAYTAVDRAEAEPARCFAVNRDGAGVVADACARARVPLIHVSTDYVFDGTQAEPYREYDAPSPINVYGASKAAGEALVRAATRRHVILRTAWVFGPDGRNFLRTVQRLAEAGRPLRIVADQLGCPTPAAALAEAIAAMAGRIITGDGAWGIFHLAGTPPTSWHGFAQAIVAAIRPGHPAPPVLPITTADYPTAARRPAQSMLACRRILASYGIDQPDWRRALDGHVFDRPHGQVAHISSIRPS